MPLFPNQARLSPLRFIAAIAASLVLLPGCAAGVFEDYVKADDADGNSAEAEELDTGAQNSGAGSSETDQTQESQPEVSPLDPICGNGIQEGKEVCDGNDLAGLSCETIGFSDGELRCAKDCRSFISDDCSRCGNGVREGKEDCDGDDLQEKSCSDLFPGASGTLACSPKCRFDTQKCEGHSCGNGMVDNGEQCDCGKDPECKAEQLAAQSCQSLGFMGGTLACRSSTTCEFDTSACHKCGDGKIDPGESCDGKNLNSQSCASLMWKGGKLACTSDCNFDTSACHNNGAKGSKGKWLIRCAALGDVWPFVDTFDGDYPLFLDINLEEEGKIRDLEVQLSITHPQVGDISVRLERGDKKIQLLTNPGRFKGPQGCTFDDIDVVLTDKAQVSADRSCKAQRPTVRGRLRATQKLRSFKGLPAQGLWSLGFFNKSSQHSGQVTRACLRYRLQ